MGSFFGHIDEGVVFITLAVWWMFNMFRDFNESAKTGIPFRSQGSYVSNIGKRKVPLEAILKIAFPTAGFLLEFTGVGIPITFVTVDDQFRANCLIHLQHMSIYGLFTVHGITDLLEHFEVSPLMEELKYSTAVIAFFWYGSQFYFHSAESTHKPPLENMIHRVPLATIFVISLLVLWEYSRREVIMPQLLRCFGVLTLGTWFTHISFILYRPTPFPGNDPNPNWDQYDVKNVQFISSLYGFHLIFNLLLMLLVYACVTSYRKLVGMVSRLLGCEETMAGYEYDKIKSIDREDNVEDESDETVTLYSYIDGYVD